MRLLVTGKTRSGKSTALHSILSHALRCPWARVLLLDGKGSELCAYARITSATARALIRSPHTPPPLRALRDARAWGL